MQTGEPEFCSPDAVKASKKTVDIAMMQYRHGLGDYQRVLETQRDLSERQENLVSTAGSVGQNLVAIYRALGGGWELRKNQDFVPQNIKEEMAQRTNWGGMLSPEKTESPPSEEVNSLINKPDW
jgi:hypothetical protein